MTAPPKRRWFRFGLRTMFVLVTFSCVVATILATQLPLILRRRTEILSHGVRYSTSEDAQGWKQYLSKHKYVRDCRISLLREMLGDKAVLVVLCRPSETDEEIDRLSELFPEAAVIRSK